MADTLSRINRLKSDAAGAEDARVRLEQTADGPVALVRGETGAWVPIHSRRDPRGEADRWLRGALAGPRPSALIVIGLGLGFVLDSVERLAPDLRVVAIEPVPALLQGLLARRDWRGAIDSDRLTICSGPGYRGAADAWRLLDADPHNVRTLEHPVIARLFPQETVAARKVAERIVFDARANDDARREHAGRYLLNTLTNLPLVGREGDATGLAGCLSGVPAIVAGAGPSLDRNLADLHAVRDHAILICVDTALRPLLAAGLAPDLVVSVDPSPLNARHLHDLAPCPHTWLAAEASLDPSVFAPFSGRTFTFRLADHHPWPWLGALGVTRPIVRTWGSVLTSAFDVALTLGCDPVAFVGADLSYTFGQPYCRRTTFDADWVSHTAAGGALPDLWRGQLESRTLIREPDLHGGETTTSPHLRAFRDWLIEQISARPDRRFVNATGAGILSGPGVEQVRLRDLLMPHSNVTSLVRAAIQRAYGTPATHPELEHAVGRLLQQATEQLPPPFEEWQEFAANAVGADEITAALTGAAAAFTAPPAARRGAGRVAPTVAPLPPPETAAILHALAAGRPLPSWLDDTLSHVAPLIDESVSTASHPCETLGRLLLDTMARQEVAGDERAAAIAAVEGALAWHIWCHRADYAPEPRSPWLELAAPRVFDAHGFRSGVRPVPPALPGALRDRLELLRVVLAAAGSLRGVRDAPLPETVDVSFWVAPELLSVATQTGTTCNEDACVRCEIALSPEEASPVARPTTVVHAALPLWSLMKLAAGTMSTWRRTDTESRSTFEGFNVIARDSRRLPGGIRYEMTATLDATLDDPRAHVLASSTSRLRPRMLNDEGLPPCCFATSLDPHHALVSAPGGSVAVGEDGSIRAASSWPRPIMNEVPWGTKGGALAWFSHDGTSYAMLRPTADATPVVDEMPFAALRVLEFPGGAALWACLDGGLWQWLPGQGGRQLVETPPVFNLHRDRTGIVLHPVPQDWTTTGFPRVLMDSGFHWEPGATQVTSLRLTPAGQCASTASAGAWTAYAHPYADLVRIEHADGGSFDLACCYPVAAGWAGSSLVVATGDGAVLFFPGLVTTAETVRSTGLSETTAAAG